MYPIHSPADTDSGSEQVAELLLRLVFLDTASHWLYKGQERIGSLRTLSDSLVHDRSDFALRVVLYAIEEPEGSRTARRTMSGFSGPEGHFLFF